MTLLRRILSWLFGSPTGTRAPVSLPVQAAAPISDAGVSDVSDPIVPTVSKPRSFGLDAADYLPISREEILQTAAGTNLFSNAWFGRRDLIPPADDPRTRLIDRAMVTEGLIAPEQLAEIHRVGDEMDRVRPSAVALGHEVARAGAAAVQADAQSRAELKARKKAEAADRKRARAQAVIQRRETDILFLGRGVSERLGQRESRTDLLEATGLPVLSTPGDVAAALGLSISRLRWLAFHAEVATRVHYVQFTVPKKGGGERVLSAPHGTLRRAQRWIFEHVVSKLPAESPAHGFLPGRSILTNAQAHAGRAIVVNLDLQDFFPSISFPRVRKVFERLGYSPAVATIFALLCTESPRKAVTFAGEKVFVATGPRGLPQGACTSPGLSNQVSRRLDRRLSGLARKLDLAYTRYADDLTFSGDGSLEGRVGYLLARVRHIAEEEGFAVKEAKTRVARRNRAQEVTGLVVNDRPGVCRSEVRRLRAMLHRARSEGLDAQNRQGLPHFRSWLRGKIEFVRMVRPETGERLLAELREVESRDREP